MYMITNRKIQKTLDNEIEFKLDVVAPDNQVHFCLSHKDLSKMEHTIHELGSKEFFKTLWGTKYKHILLYIHGYNTLPNDALLNAYALQNLFDNIEIGEVAVIPIIWPCQREIGIDYWDDQKSADASGMSISRALLKFFKYSHVSNEICTRSIHILSHSMGNRVLRETLLAAQKYDLRDGLPIVFKNTFLIAADIPNHDLQKGEPGSVICDASAHVHVSYAPDDLALNASKIANIKNRIASRRLGHTGIEDISLCLDNITQVNCNEFNNQYDKLGHTYFIEDELGNAGILFKYIHSCMRKKTINREGEINIVP